MRILSIDSAGHGCGVGVWHDGVVLAEAHESMERGQDARLVPLLLEVMAKATIDFAQLDRIAVTRGPGSFTGLRIGLAAARGIGLASGKPVIGIDRFSIYRDHYPNNEVLVVLDSKRSELFCQFFPADAAPHEPIMLAPDALEAFVAGKPKLIITGDALKILAAHDVLKNLYHPATEPECITAARLAANASLDDAAFLPRPYYLRAPDVTMKKSA